MRDDDYREWQYGPYGPYGMRRYVVRDIGDEDLNRQNPPRTKREYPYSYDPLTIWGKRGPSKECNGSVYTDRLEQWDYSKYHRLVKEIYEGARPFDSHHCRGDLVEKFLREYYDDPTIKLLRVIEYCNWSSGYPTWRLDYVTTKET